MAEFSRMVDIHCHFLPGVDDGAASLQEGLDLVKAASANGISRILLTPHIHAGRYDNTLAALQLRFESFRRALSGAHIPVEIALAAEVRCNDELIGLVERDEVPLVRDARGNKVLLLEMPHSHVPPGVEKLVAWLQKRDIRPLLAHPERNKELIAHPERLVVLCRAGCLMQITAASVIGRFGERAKNAAHLLLENDLVHVIATDSHNLQHRPPLLREAARWVAQRYGDEHAWRLVGANPAALSAGNFSRRVARGPEVASASVRSVKRPVLPSTGADEVVSTGEKPKDLCEATLEQMHSDLRARVAQAAGAEVKAKRSTTQRGHWRNWLSH